MKETIRKIQGLPSTPRGFTSTFIKEGFVKFSPMTKWHGKRKPYSVGGAPLSEVGK